MDEDQIRRAAEEPRTRSVDTRTHVSTYVEAFPTMRYHLDIAARNDRAPEAQTA